MVLRILTREKRLSSTGLSPSLVGFSKTLPLIVSFVTLWCILTCTGKSYNTSATASQSCNVDKGLGCSDFAHRYFRNRGFFLLLQVLRCFNSLGMARLQLRVSKLGFPIRKSPDQRLLTTPRRLSQKATSFIAFLCLGIRRMPLLTWPYYSFLQSPGKFALCFLSQFHLRYSRVIVVVSMELSLGKTACRQPRWLHCSPPRWSSGRKWFWSNVSPCN